jgi:beta-mannanase
MNKSIFLKCLLVIGILASAFTVQAQSVNPTPADPNANATARSILNYLYALPNQSQNRLLSGQYGFYGGETSAATGQEQLQEVFDDTGLWPAVTGADFQRPDRTPDQSVNEATTWLIQKWNEGYLINASWHAQNPCTGGSAGLESPTPPLDLDRVLPGGNCHSAWLQSLDRVAAGLQRLEDAGAVVIWRPLHEMNGAWFWWHQNPPYKFIALWRHMFTYFTQTKGLNNLLWAYSPNYEWDQWAPDVLTFYPGAQYVDIVGIDKYMSCNNGSPENPIDLSRSYNDLVSTGKPIGLLELGIIPVSGACYDLNPYGYRWDHLVRDIQAQYPRIVMFQAWEWIWQLGRDNYRGLPELLNNPWVVTRHEVPNFAGGIITTPAPTATRTMIPATPTATATRMTPTTAATNTPVVPTNTPIAPTSTPPQTGAANFYRAINLNGPALVIDGNAWEGTTAANFSADGQRFCASWVTLAPATDANRQQMLRCHVQHWAHNLLLSGVPAGAYQVYLYVWLDWANPNPDTFSIQMEGVTVQTGIRLTGVGEWKRIGPYQAAISDGGINITTTGGIANLSGIEVYRVGGSSVTPTTPPVQTSTPVPTSTLTSTLPPTTVAPTATLTSTPTATVAITNTPTATYTSTRVAPNTPTTLPTMAPTSTPVSGGTPGFYRAINLNGPAVVIDGNRWEESTAANYTLVGSPFCSPWTSLVPATDAARTQMVQCSVQHWAHNLVLSSVPAGNYEVYLYVWLDWANPNPDSFSIQVEGVTVQNGIRVARMGEWRRVGPFRSTIADGTINVTTTGGLANLSGIEVYRVGGAPTTPVPTSILPATSTPSVASTQTPVVPATATPPSTPTLIATTAVPQTPTTFPTTAPTSTPVVVGVPGFYRAINLNGPAVVIDGNPWEGASAANYTLVGSPFCAPWTSPVPATDTARLQMIQCYVQHWAHNLVLSSVPAGNYEVYLYVWLDWANPNPEAFNVQLEGVMVETGVRVASVGEWKRVGPYRTTVTDGTLNVTTTGGLANLSGIEIYSMSGESRANTPILSPTTAPGLETVPSTIAPPVALEVVPPTLMPTATPTGSTGEGVNTEVTPLELPPNATSTGIPAGG